MISQLIASGPASFFEPINGYLIVLPRILIAVAMLAPFGNYPLTVTVLAWIVTTVLLISVALLPSELRGRPFLVAVALFVPTDAEVYGLSLYTFWWSAVALFAACFWCDGKVARWLRPIIIVIAGLSSPAVILAAPLYLLNIFRKRERKESVIAAALVIICSLIQLAEIASTGAEASHINLTELGTIVEKFVGGYIAWNLTPNAMREYVSYAAGIISLAVIAIAFRRQERSSYGSYALVFLWLGSVFLSATRVDATMLDPAAAGPRYFFLPFIFQGWLLVQLAIGSQSRLVRSSVIALILCAFVNSIPVLSRTHDDLAWKKSVTDCAKSNSQTFNLPIEFDGHAASHWNLPMTGAVCKKLTAGGITAL